MSRSAISRLTLAVALAAGALHALPAEAQQRGQRGQQQARPSFSPAFAKAAEPLDRALAEAAKNPAVQAARAQVAAAKDNPQAKAAAVAQVDAALGGGQAKLAAATAAATTPTDKFKLADLTRSYGILTEDLPMQFAGLTGMLDSGQLPAESVGQVQFFAGIAAYQLTNYAGAVKYLEPAKASGYKDQQGLLDQVLLDAYKRSNNGAGALAMAQREIAAAKAAGAKPNEASIRVALQAAYDARNAAQSAEYSALLVRNYPNVATWKIATSIVGATSEYQGQDTLDLLRLMSRANALADGRDYLTYIRVADARRFPGEVGKIIDAGIAAGKLNTGDAEVAQAKTIASGRVAADRASLPTLERDARAPAASLTTIVGAADAFLSYGEPAKAVEFYSLALTKPGGDAQRLQTRLGIAQIDKGDYAAAQATFAKVTGPRQPLAELWSIYAGQKAAGN